jgi:hypothetical protein
MIKIMVRSLASLTVGAAFGLAMSTTMPDPHAVASAAGAAAFMYGGMTYSARIDRREAATVVQEEDGDG